MTLSAGRGKIKKPLGAGASKYYLPGRSDRKTFAAAAGPAGIGITEIKTLSIQAV